MKNQIKSNINKYYDNLSPIDNYSSILKSEPSSSKYYINMINHDPNNFDFGVHNKLYESFYPNQPNRIDSFLTPHQPNYPKTTSYYKKDISNTYTNIRAFSLLDKKDLSNLSLNKYMKMRETDNFGTIKQDDKKLINKFNINCTDSINGYNDVGKKLNNNEDIEKNNIINVKTKSILLKHKMRLKNEIINYNKLENKINKKIEKIKSQKKLRENKQNYNGINFNEDEFKYKISNISYDCLINNMQANKTLKRKRGEDDIPNNHKNTQNNTIFENNNNKQKDDDISSNFIRYLKKDNQKLLHVNSKYKQLIDTFFYFVNQLSKKYAFKKEIKDVQYYLSNANHLSNILIDLEQHLNKMIKYNNVADTNDKNEEKEKENDTTENDQELLTESKFIKMNDIKNKIKNLKLDSLYKTRNKSNKKKDYLTLNDKNVFSAKNIVNRTLQNNSLYFFNGLKEGINNYENKNKVIKIKKKNGKLVKIMNKLNFDFFSPRQKVNNKIIFKKKVGNSNDGKRIYQKMNESNDLKSIINPIYINNSYKNEKKIIK